MAKSEKARRRRAMADRGGDAFRLQPKARIWQHGRKDGYAVCPKCRKKIDAGAWVQSAPGTAGVIRHVKCGGR